MKELVSIAEAQAEIVEDFTMLDDWMDRYQLLIDMGEEQAPLPEQYKTPENLIDGCQSRVWIVCEERDGRLHLEAESDALIVKGIIALLIRVFDGHSPQEIMDARLDFIDEIGLHEHLSPTRSNGLSAMLKKIKSFALVYGARPSVGG